METISLVAAKREIAVSLWREKRFAEAERVLNEADADAESAHPEPDELVALAMTRSMVYRAQGRHLEARDALMRVGPLAEVTTDVLLRGKFHNGLGITLWHLRKWDKCFEEYTAASVYHELAGAAKARAEIENNLGNLRVEMGEPEKAHPHLDTALSGCSELVFVAQVNDTRARAFLAEDLKDSRGPDGARLASALDAALRSVTTLRDTPEKRLYAESIATLRRVCERIERLHEHDRIREAVSEHGIKQAAALLGMSHQTLRYKLDNQFPDLLPVSPPKKRPRGAGVTKKVK